MPVTIDTEKIRNEVMEKLKWDSRIDASNIQVEVENGTVKLLGSVPSIKGREAAQLDAYLVPGVNSVSNFLQVMLPSELARPTDTEIKEYVASTLLWNFEVGTQIHVSVDHGVITLTGHVDAFWKKEKAEELITGIIGVAGVRNEIEVRPPEERRDEMIKDRIESSLEFNPSVDSSKINVDVREGKVILTGSVPNKTVREMVLNTVRFTHGVQEIEDRLQEVPF